MSSFEVGGVSGVAVDVGLLAVEASVGVAAAGVALAGGAIAATGYAFYKVGDTAYKKMMEIHQTALDEQFKKQAEERVRYENAIISRKEVIAQCEEEIKVLENVKDENIKKIALDVCMKLREICSDTSDMDIFALENKNRSDKQKVKTLIENFKNNSALVREQEEANSKFRLFFDSVEKIFENMEVDKYDFVHNVMIDTAEQVDMRKANEKAEKLITEFYYHVNREIDRYGKVPLEGIERVEEQFKTISGIIEKINDNRSNKENLVFLVNKLEDAIDTYKTFSAITDKEQQKFMQLYFMYQKSFEMIKKSDDKKDNYNEIEAYKELEDCKEEVEFHSYEDLKKAMKDRYERLELMRKKAEIYEKLGREAYLCLAFETELSKLNYMAVDKNNAETMLGRKLTNFKIGDKLSPFYEGKNGSKSRIYKIDDKIGVELIIHENGTSTMETISLDKNSDDIVISAQKEHCQKSEVLADALWKKWFIKIDITETESPLIVKRQFSTGEVEVNRDDTKARLEAARKERRRNNAEKAKLRSKRLNYFRR